MAQSEMQRFPEPWMIEKDEKAYVGAIRTDWW